MCEVNRQRKRLDRLIDLYADSKYDRMMLDHKMETIERQLEKARKQLERAEVEIEQIGKGKAQRARAKEKLQELKESGLGSCLEQRGEKIDFDDRRRLLEAFLQSSNDYIAISGSGRALRASGLRQRKLSSTFSPFWVGKTW